MKTFIIQNIASVANGITLVFFVVLWLLPVIIGSLRGWTFSATTWVTYMGIAVWGILICMLAPLWLFRFTGEKEVWKHFPDGPGAAAMIIVGWIPAAVMTVIAKTIVGFVRRKQTPTSDQ